MDECLNCGQGMVAEYDSQVCLHCAGELPGHAPRRRVSLRRLLVALHIPYLNAIDSGGAPILRSTSDPSPVRRI
jgi:hypothetical protein